MSMERLDGVRAGNQERTAVVRRLDEAFYKGYLNGDEHTTRTARAWNAQFVSELAPLITDIPHFPTFDEQMVRVLKSADPMHLWLAGIPAGLIVMTVPVSVIVSLPAGIGPGKAALIAWSMIVGLYIVILCIVKSVEAYDRRHKGCNH